jgi:hypothetical protein
MPILRAFWGTDRVSPAAFPRLGCLISGNAPMKLLSS